MKISQLKKIIKEAVKASIQEEMKEILIEAVNEAKKGRLEILEKGMEFLNLLDKFNNPDTPSPVT